MSYSDDLKTLVEYGLGNIPDVGWLLRAFVEILWPDSGTDVWGQIESQVEALIGQEIAQSVYQQVSQDLAGLNNVLGNYLQAVAQWQQDPASPTTTDAVIAQYNAATDLFVDNEPHFQAAGYEILLLPLFAQMANLYLAVLRDGVNNAVAWSVPNAAETLTATIADYRSYTSGIFNSAYQALPLTGETIPDWQTQNTYVQQMALSVMDFYYFWPYFNPSAGAPPPLTREIYATMQATSGTLVSKWGIIIVPIDELSNPVNRPPIASLAIWGSTQIDGFQLAFGEQTAGPVMGSSSTSDAPPGGWSGAISASNPIFQIGLYGGANLSSLWLWFLGGGVTNICGSQSLGTVDGNSQQTWGFDGHVLSSIAAFGETGNSIGSAAIVVFGFRYQNSYSGWATPPVYASISHGNSALGKPGGMNDEMTFFGAGTDLIAFCGADHHLYAVTTAVNLSVCEDITAALSNPPLVFPGVSCSTGMNADLTLSRWVAFQGWDSAASGADGHVYLASQNLAPPAPPSAWSWIDLWSQCGCTVACVNAGPLATYCDNNGPVIAFRGADNHVYQVSLTGSSTDLTVQAAGTPDAASDPAAIFFPNSYYTVFQGAADQQLYLVMNLPLVGWSGQNIWAQSGCSILPVSGGGISLSGDQDMGLCVFFRGTDGHIYMLLGNPGFSPWNTVVDLMALNPLAPAAAGDPSATLLDGSLRVVYRGADNNIYKMWNDIAANQWYWKNLTMNVSNPVPAASDPAGAVLQSTLQAPQTATLQTLYAEHVLYLGTDGAVYDLFGDSD